MGSRIGEAKTPWPWPPSGTADAHGVDVTTTESTAEVFSHPYGLRDHNRTWQPKKGELVRRAPSDIHTAGTRCQGCGRREPPKVGFTSVAPPRLARPATHDAAIGALRPFVVRSCVRRPARQSRARAGCSASPRRSALRADSPALLGLVARRQTHCAHFVRCVQTNGDKSVVDARCARGHTPCDARRLRGAAHPARARLCRTGVCPSTEKPLPGTAGRAARAGPEGRPQLPKARTNSHAGRPR